MNEKQKDRQKESMRKYYLKNKPAFAKRTKLWQKENLQKFKACCLEYRLRNPQKTKNVSRKWREGNPEKVKQYARGWYQENKIRLRNERREI